MKPAAFAYHAPESVDAALGILTEVGHDDGRVLAGGQTLVPAMALRLARPSHLVDINAIESLKHLEIDDGWIEIGACVRHAAFHRNADGGPTGALMTNVVRHIAHPPIRARGTFCGSIANADPASEWCLVATTLGAEVVAASLVGRREIPADEFFLGFMTTSLAPDELLVATRLPRLDPSSRFGFAEFSRRAGDFAQAMALVVWNDVEGIVSDARVGIGGVEPRTRRLPEAEAELAGKQPSPQLFARVAEIASAVVRPTDGTPDGDRYRRELVKTVVARALATAAAGIRQDTTGAAR